MLYSFGLSEIHTKKEIMPHKRQVDTGVIRLYLTDVTVSVTFDQVK